MSDIDSCCLSFRDVAGLYDQLHCLIAIDIVIFLYYYAWLSPEDSVKCTAVPIPKEKNVNLTDSRNYRGISLFCKLYDLIVLS
jgi:hypothetical protein